MDSDSAPDPAAAGVGPASIPASSSSSVAANVEVTRRAGCSLLPHGGYTLIPATLSTLGWICSLAQDGCDYSRLEGPTVEALTNVGGVPYLEVGFNAYRAPRYVAELGEWRVDFLDKCSEYDPNVVDLDVYWKVGKAFEFLSLVMGGGAALFLWFSSCFVFSPATWKWAGYEVALAAIFQSFAFIWFMNAMCREDSNTCGLFIGSNADIAAACLWFFSAVAIFAKYPHAQQAKEGDASLSDLELAEEEDGFENDDRAALELPVDGAADAKMAPPIDPELEVPERKVHEAEMA